MCECTRLFKGNKDNDENAITKADVHDNLTDLMTHIRMISILNDNISDLEEKTKKTRSRTTKRQIKINLNDMYSDRTNILGLVKMMFDKYEYKNDD